MSKNSASLAASLLNHSFIALVFSLAGWVLLEAWLLTMHAGWPGQATSAIPGMVLVLLSVKHSSLYRSRSIEAEGVGIFQGRRISGVYAAWTFLLFAVGGLTGLLILKGEMVFLVVLAVALGCIPWSRIPICRNHFFAACMTMWAGMALPLFVERQAIATMFLPIACWVLWTCACFLLLSRVEKLWRSARGPKAAVAASEAQPLAD